MLLWPLNTCAQLSAHTPPHEISGLLSIPLVLIPEIPGGLSGAILLCVALTLPQSMVATILA